MLIIDFSQVFISTIMNYLATEKKIALDEYEARCICLSTIIYFKKMFRNEFDTKEIVFAVDSKNYWRKDLFPYYKGKRKENRDKSKYDWGNIYSNMNIIEKDLREHFPYVIVKVDKAEADDVIAILSKHIANTEEKKY